MNTLNTSKLIEVLNHAVLLCLSRSGDVDTVDGSFATVETDEITRLESALSELLNQPCDDIDISNIGLLCDEVKKIQILIEGKFKNE